MYCDKRTVLHISLAFIICSSVKSFTPPHLLNHYQHVNAISISEGKNKCPICKPYPKNPLYALDENAVEVVDEFPSNLNDDEDDIDIYNEVPEDPDDYDNVYSEQLGTWNDDDLNCKSKYDFVELSETDPNLLQPDLEYIENPEVDDDGVELGWDPMYGPSNPFDKRTIVTPVESYIIDPKCSDPAMVAPKFKNMDQDENPEVNLDQHVTQVRKDMKLIESYTDPWLNESVPRNIAPWYGHPEKEFPKKDFMNNRFTKPEDKTDFTVLDPYRARKKAMEMARSRNNEWLPDGVSQAQKLKRNAIFKEKEVLVGSLKKGEIDEAVMEQIQPALKIFGNSVELLQINKGDTFQVFRFHYKAAMKNRRGMAAWMGVLIRDCDVECTGVVFEIGGRERDYNDGPPP